jgi:hypothetical protein
MRQKLGLWALIGLLVACGWVLYSIVAGPFTNQNPGTWTIAAITAPASLIGRAMPLKYYWFILLNGAAYALLGLTAELIRRVIVSLFKLTHRPSLA